MRTPILIAVSILETQAFSGIFCKLVLKLRVLARAWLSSFGVLWMGVTHGSQVSSTSGHTGSQRECIPDVVTQILVLDVSWVTLLKEVGLGGGPKRNVSGGRSLFRIDGKLLWRCW